MKWIAAFVLTLFVGMAANGVAQAQQAPAQQPTLLEQYGIYVRGSLGFSWSLEDEIDYSPLWGIGAGLRTSPNLRFDLTLDWRDRYIVEGGRGFIVGGTAIDSQVENWTLMVNGYYELERLPLITLPAALSPYLGAGLGIAHNEIDDEPVLVEGEVARVTGDDENQFAWQLMLGVGYNITSQLVLDLAYRFADLGDIEATSPAGEISNDFTVNELVATLRYAF